MADSDDPKAALIAQLAAQRARISQHAECVRESVNVGKRVKANFSEHSATWLGGAAVAGLLLSRLRSGKKAKSNAARTTFKTAASAGLAWPIAKLLFDLARPALVSILTARLTSYVASRTSSKRGWARSGF